MWQNWSLGHQMPEVLPVDRRIQPRSHPDLGTRVENKSRPCCWFRQWLWCPMWWSPCQNHYDQHWYTHWSLGTVTMPAEIGQNHHGSLQCKVNTGASGHVMPLCIFAKLFPRCITRDGKPTSIHPCDTTLMAYNGLNIPQFGALDTAIEWTPKGH